MSETPRKRVFELLVLFVLGLFFSTAIIACNGDTIVTSDHNLKTPEVAVQATATDTWVVVPNIPANAISIELVPDTKSDERKEMVDTLVDSQISTEENGDLLLTNVGIPNGCVLYKTQSEDVCAQRFVFVDITCKDTQECTYRVHEEDADINTEDQIGELGACLTYTPVEENSCPATEYTLVISVQKEEVAFTGLATKIVGH